MAETAAQKKAREANKDQDAESGAQGFIDEKGKTADGQSVLTGVAITSNQIRNWFNATDLDAEQQAAADRVNDGAAALCQMIADNAPNCEDRRAAIHKVREAAFLSNAAISNRGR